MEAVPPCLDLLLATTISLHILSADLKVTQYHLTKSKWEKSNQTSNQEL